MRPVRVRFAPSPTGALHIGGVRTALYNFLLARKHGGTMILRIEDTDQARYVEGAEEYILESLKWVGIAIDEGVGTGGPHAPYRQSERKEIYQKYALQLVNEGKAYYAFDTEEELQAMRTRLKEEASGIQQYGATTRMSMRNSLTLSAGEVAEKINRGEPYVIRLKVPAEQVVEVADLIRGHVSVHSSQIDDKVLMKSDGMPTYHLANVVDDYLMQISHVIRGEEWLPSAPLHVLLYQSFGWQQAMPQFAHLPLLLKPDGNGKLSKRDADQMGFPIFPLNWKDPHTQELAKGFCESGYLPEALLNFLALLGWNPGTEQELFSLPQLIDAFSIERISKAGAKFDIQKAQWFNQQYLRTKTEKELCRYLYASLGELGIDCEEEKAEKICRAMRERITFPNDIFANGKFFFYAPNTFDEQVVQKKWNDEAVAVLAAYRDELNKSATITAEKAKLVLDGVCTRLNTSVGKVLQALRLAITGQGSGPDLMLTIEILEPQEAAARLDFAIQNIQAKK